MNKVRKYFNPAQREAMAVGAKNEFIVASRGFGKSEGIDAPRLLRNTFAMPGSNGILLSNTYSKLLQNTLPAVLTALSRLGYKRDRHYVIGKKPPRHLNFAKPLQEIINYDYIISWFNGSTQTLISFDRPMSVNSMSVDYLLGFEAKYLNYEKIVSEVFPALRGKRQHFGDCPWHHGMVFTTDMPTLKSGMWILDKQKEMDKELIAVIKYIYGQIVALKLNKENVSEHYYDATYKRLSKELATFRKNATFYAEYNVFDNLEILGEKFIRDQKRILPPFLFSTSILNVRPRKVPNGFYSGLKERLHYYTAANHSFLDSLEFDIKRSSNPTWEHDGDLSNSEPLAIAFDHNSAINNVVTGQLIGNVFQTVNVHYVKTPRKLADLCNEWSDYYHGYPNRHIVYYYDHTSIGASASTPDTFKDIVIRTLKKRGWQVNAVYIGQALRHDLKHEMIQQALMGDAKYPFPKFNSENCELLLSAMEQTGIIVGRNGFSKDKGSEKLPDSPDNPDELKTHVTDAWDTLFIGIVKKKPTLAASTLPLITTIQ